MLQHRRALIIDTVAENIATEVRRGTVLRRAVVRERLRSEGGGQAVEDDEEILVEKAVSFSAQYSSSISFLNYPVCD